MLERGRGFEPLLQPWKGRLLPLQQPRETAPSIPNQEFKDRCAKTVSPWPAHGLAAPFPRRMHWRYRPSDLDSFVSLRRCSSLGTRSIASVHAATSASQTFVTSWRTSGSATRTSHDQPPRGGFGAGVASATVMWHSPYARGSGRRAPRPRPTDALEPSSAGKSDRARPVARPSAAPADC